MNPTRSFLGIVLVFLCHGMIFLFPEWFVSTDAIEFGEIICFILMLFGLYNIIGGFIE